VLAIKNEKLEGFEYQRNKSSSVKPPLPEKIKPILKTKNSWLKVNFNVGKAIVENAAFQISITNVIARVNKELYRKTKPMEILSGDRSCYMLLAFVCVKMIIT